MPTDKVKAGQLNLAFVFNDKENGNPAEICVARKSEKVEPTRNYGPGERIRMLKNVAVISFAFTLLFTAYQSMANLQSSLNPVDGLGNYSLSTLYAAIVVSSMFLPTLLIRKFTVKWTLVGSMFGYILYIGAQFHAKFYTLIPAALILGITAGPLWSAKSTYLTHIGREYAGEIGESPDDVIVRFFGMFYLAYQSSEIWGNLISSEVLSTGGSVIPRNISVCGATFCPSDAKAGILEEIDQSKLYVLVGIYMACAGTAALVVAIFVDPLFRYGENDRRGEFSKLSGCQLLTATGRQMIKPYQLLIIPITIWTGMEQGFFGADFTQAFVSCAWGIHHIGSVIICYGVCDAIASISFGPIIRRVGRVPVFVFAALTNLSAIIILFQWKPSPSAPIVFFVIAGLWGIADGIWQTQLNAFYGVIFYKNEEAAFSNHRLWESTGFIISYINGSNACMNVKLFALVGVLLLGMTGYLTAEFLESRKAKANNSN